MQQDLNRCTVSAALTAISNTPSVFDVVVCSCRIMRQMNAADVLRVQVVPDTWPAAQCSCHTCTSVSSQTDIQHYGNQVKQLKVEAHWHSDAVDGSRVSVNV